MRLPHPLDLRLGRLACPLYVGSYPYVFEAPLQGRKRALLVFRRVREVLCLVGHSLVALLSATSYFDDVDTRLLALGVSLIVPFMEASQVPSAPAGIANTLSLFVLPGGVLLWAL